METQITRINNSTITEKQLDERITVIIDEAKVTGLGLAIFNKGEIVYQKAFGYSNIETKDTLTINHVFYGASLSKSVFGYLVAQLVKEKKIDLDRPINSYFEIELPDIPIEKGFRKLDDLKEDERYKELTARMCLSHTTGLPNWRWINNPEGKLNIQFDPGTNYSYSGEGIMIAQWLVEQVTKKKLEDLANEQIFKPLNMNWTDYLWRAEFKGHFCYGHSKQGEKLRKDIETEDAAAAGSMETTLVDYSKFLKHVLKLYKENAEITKILFQPNIRIRSKAQFGPLAKEITNENDEIELSYGLGWGLLKSKYGIGAFKEGHGEGFQHYSILFPDKEMGILLMSNSDNAESTFKEILELAIGDIYTPWKWENYIPYNLKK